VRREQLSTFPHFLFFQITISFFFGQTSNSISKGERSQCVISTHDDTHDDIGSVFVGLLPHLLQRHVLVLVFVHDLGDSKLKVFLSDVNTALTKSKHTGLGTDSLDLGT
jgi:hypothetical protein